MAVAGQPSATLSSPATISIGISGSPDTRKYTEITMGAQRSRWGSADGVGLSRVDLV